MNKIIFFFACILCDIDTYNTLDNDETPETVVKLIKKYPLESIKYFFTTIL